MTGAITMDTGMDTTTTTRPGDGAQKARTFLRLLQLASPTLPIGAFAYSQGLEPAVAAGRVVDEPSAAAWISGLLQGPLTTLDLAVFVRVHRAFVAADNPTAQRWNAFLFASRATAELQAEDRHLGSALGRVLETMGLPSPAPPPPSDAPTTFVTAFARAAAHWALDLPSALQAFAFAWAEAQVSAAVRLVPLGQSAGVRILSQLAAVIPGVVERALSLPDEDISAAAPLQAILSAAHETQYSRLFRS